MKYIVYCRKSSTGEGRQALSIASQHADIERLMPHWNRPEIVGCFDEQRTAKVPGRPVFNRIMKDIERGRADGIIAWHPDRLSRNPTDAGRVMQALATGKLRDLKFVAYTFENNAEGRFMLAIMLGQATYYSDNLSNRVKLAVKTKLSQGWIPWLAPLGYLNDRTTRTIVTDPERFNVVRELLRRFLTGNISARRLWEIATQEWGLRTRSHPRLGNKPVSLAGVYRILTNPFYSGLLEHNGQFSPGKHKPMITIGEFNRIQQLLGRPHAPKPKRRTFAFTGMIRCGECGFSVTAEERRNKYGSTYVYYHCSKRRLDYRCQQRVLPVDALVTQLAEFVQSLTIPDELHRWALGQLEQMAVSKDQSADAQLQSIAQALEMLTRETTNLVSMRLRDLMSDSEYAERRRDLDLKRATLEEQREAAKKSRDWFESARTLLSFSNRAADCVRMGSPRIQRLVVEIVGSNSTLRNRILSVEARKPFRSCSGPKAHSALRATMYDVRTLVQLEDSGFAAMVAQMNEVLEEADRLKGVREEGGAADLEVPNIPTSTGSKERRNAA